jgi:hypothetical protein
MNSFLIFIIVWNFEKILTYLDIQLQWNQWWDEEEVHICDLNNYYESIILKQMRDCKDIKYKEQEKKFVTLCSQFFHFLFSYIKSKNLWHVVISLSLNLRDAFMLLWKHWANFDSFSTLYFDIITTQVWSPTRHSVALLERWGAMAIMYRNILNLY